MDMPNRNVRLYVGKDLVKDILQTCGNHRIIAEETLDDLVKQAMTQAFEKAREEIAADERQEVWDKQLLCIRQKLTRVDLLARGVRAALLCKEGDTDMDEVYVRADKLEDVVSALQERLTFFAQGD